MSKHNSRVNKLRLSYNQLTGIIPAQLGGLLQLTHLDLWSNQLSGTIPVELSNLANLNYLELGGNLLTGSIPPELGSLTQLIFLNLWGNQLTGSIPPELGNLTNLTNLALGNNQLTGSIPPELGNLTNLNQELWLGFNQLTGSIPPELGNLTKLDTLVLFSNQLTGSIPPELGNLTNLTFLDLRDNQLSGSIPPELGNLTKLEELWLWVNDLSGSIPPELGNLTNLTALGLFANNLSGNLPPEFGNLTKLTYLRVDFNQLSGEIPASITNLVNLTELMFDCSLTSTDPVVIAFIQNLKPGWQGRCPVISGNTGLGDVILSYRDGVDRTFTSAADGNYSFPVWPGWSGAVTPSKTGHVFIPSNRTYDNVQADTPDENYTAIAIYYTISGNAGVAGATLSYTDGTPKTVTADESGNYSLIVSYNWFGTVTPSKANYTFSPANRTYAGILANITGENYTVAPIAYTTTLYSPGAQDGWILETGEKTNKGGTLDAKTTTFRLGDDAVKKQYLGILSFSTGAGLPDNAVITKVTLKVKKQGVIGGGNPVTTFQGFMADIKTGTLGTSALQTGDFQAKASKTYGPFKSAMVGGWYSLDLTAGKGYINKLSTASGLTQIRLRFKLDDNNNAVANYLSLYSGNAPVASRPQLIIEYYVP